MMWMSGVYLYLGTELDEEEIEVLKRFSKKMTTDMENRQKKGMIMVRKSSRWTGGVMAGGSTDTSIFLSASVTFINFLFLMFSRVEFIFSLSISPKKLVLQIFTNDMTMTRVMLHLIS